MRNKVDGGKVGKIQFPVFSTEIHPVDIVFGDYDGVIVIPSKTTQEIITRAVKKVKRENITREELRNGATLRQVFDKYGVL